MSLKALFLCSKGEKTMLKRIRKIAELIKVYAVGFNVKYKLKKAIKKGVGINIAITPDMRQIGKTTLLIKISNEKKIPLLVPTERRRQLAMKMGCKYVISLSRFSNIRGRKIKEALYDEGFDIDTILKIHNYCTAYGFYLKKGY